ncbi:MAG TPA: adenylyl-sulfate kinase [Candidatus Polarisedimenticolia bacterium]|nr:adenylyl-sulfate kinase [Candidatus Polarisedimenticolia bacterium]
MSLATPRREQGVTIWLTGLPSAGKSTIARLLASRLEGKGFPVEILDGDEVRERLSKGLGFSREDRDENIRRISYVARLLTRAGGVVIVAAVSPYRAARDAARDEIRRFIEVHVDCPVEECIQRDVKGLYKKALAGQVPRFTGVSDPYESPLKPEVVLRTAEERPEQSVQTILNVLQILGFLPAGLFEAFTPEEEAKVVARLKSLGYLQ